MEFLKKVKLAFFTAVLFSSVSIFAATDDAALQKEVASRVDADQTVSGSDVNIEARNGVIFLTGTTSTDQEASTLVEISSATPGVKEVDTSKLKTTKSEHPLDDTFITAKVKGEFLKNKLFGDDPAPVMSVSVETKNGVVFLTGTAKNKQQASNAVRLAKSVKGVKKVTSTVTVDSKK
ncbi:MAG: osmY 3 [Gammaproteobacteria bacterium]|jgi:hyperosmotically inducible protein|nr:osmY 3 [Gammaproteobacteria bacterium]